MRQGVLGSPFRWLASVLLVGLLAPIGLPIVESVDAAAPPGIFDDADDDSLIATLSSLDLTLVAPLPAPPLELPAIVVGLAPVLAEAPAPYAAVVPAPSRSPPLA